MSQSKFLIRKNKSNYKGKSTSKGVTHSLSLLNLWHWCYCKGHLTNPKGTSKTNSGIVGKNVNKFTKRGLNNKMLEVLKEHDPSCNIDAQHF